MREGSRRSYRVRGQNRIKKEGSAPEKGELEKRLRRRREEGQSRPHGFRVWNPLERKHRYKRGKILE